jgi:lipoate-protein ligase A
MKTLHWISLRHTPIQEQLQLEETLLRNDTRNFCIVNHGSPRSIVMGISGKSEELLHLPLVAQDKIPVLRRFSGGGTVIIDEETLFVTFIFDHKTLNLPPYPEPIMRWTSQIYEEAWTIPGFTLLENDYTIYDKKCGGNAQYIKKDRFLHHTSFLWDFSFSNMQYLQLPARRPSYRKDRPHHEFLCTLKTFGGTLEDRITQLHDTLVKHFYIINTLSKKEPLCLDLGESSHLLRG